MRSVSRPISTANKYLRNKHEKITGSPSRATNHLVRAKGFLKMTVKSENEICKLKYKLHSQKSKTPKSKFTLKFSWNRNLSTPDLLLPPERSLME